MRRRGIDRGRPPIKPFEITFLVGGAFAAFWAGDAVAWFGLRPIDEASARYETMQDMASPRPAPLDLGAEPGGVK